MCGRFVVAGERRDLVRLFEVEIEADDLPPRSWNIRPTDPINVVIDTVEDDRPRLRRLEAARWSLTPSFSTTLKMTGPTFNARSESAASKPMFSRSVTSKRAIIPASGYFEWKTEGKTKTPFYIHPPAADGSDSDRTTRAPVAEMVGFAGLYSWWRDDEKSRDDPRRWILTATILTMDAVGRLRDIHDRAPVTLPRNWWDDWLDPSTRGDQAMVDAAIAAARTEAASLELHQVAPIRGDDRAELIDPL